MSHAQQVAATGGRLKALDGLRALALTLVFGFHTWEFSGHPDLPPLTTVVAQNTRPDFFVVLTGFVLTLPFARHPDRVEDFDPRAYLRRRLRRIVPPYYAALLFAVLLPQVLVAGMRGVGRPARWQPVPQAGDWVTHLTFTHLFHADHWDGINGSLWTMSLEMQLYLLFPVVLGFYAHAHRAWFAAALAVCFSYRAAAGGLLGDVGFPIDFLIGANGIGRLGEFVFGMGAAFALVRLNWTRPAPRLGLCATVVVGYLSAVCMPVGLESLGFREFALGVTFAALILAVLCIRGLDGVFGSRPVSWIGYRAYSLFLVHQPLMWFFSEFLTKMLHISDGPVKLLVLWTAGFATLLVVGQTFFLLIERPCIAWAKRTPLNLRRDAASLTRQPIHS